MDPINLSYCCIYTQYANSCYVKWTFVASVIRPHNLCWLHVWCPQPRSIANKFETLIPPISLVFHCSIGQFYRISKHTEKYRRSGFLPHGKARPDEVANVLGTRLGWPLWTYGYRLNKFLPRDPWFSPKKIKPWVAMEPEGWSLFLHFLHLKWLFHAMAAHPESWLDMTSQPPSPQDGTHARFLTQLVTKYAKSIGMLWTESCKIHIRIEA
jgi:hypothetical protein